MEKCSARPPESTSLLLSCAATRGPCWRYVEVALMTAATLLYLLTTTGLIAMMLSMGFKSSIREVAEPLRNARLIVNGLLVNFVMAPAATGVLLYAFNADPFVSAGFLILAVFPGAPVGPPITALVKGDVSYATGLMIILAGLSAILSP